MQSPGKTHFDVGAPAQGTSNRRFASQQVRALAQTHQTEGIRLARILRRESKAVIVHADRHLGSVLLDRNLGSGGTRVLGDVGQRLLDDAKDRSRMRVM